MPRAIAKRLPLSAAKMKETNIEGVYEDGSTHYFFETAALTNTTEAITVRGYKWFLGYKICHESGSTLVKVSADFASRYSFSDKAILEVTVKAADKKITEEFDLEKDTGQCFNVDLTKNEFSEVEDEDIEVTCKVKVTEIKYTAYVLARNGNCMELLSSFKRPHDVVLVVGEKKFYLQKTYLAVWSRYFNTLFYGNFAEKHKKEIKIKDVDSEEFETLLKIIYPDMGTKIYGKFSQYDSLATLQKIHKRPASELKSFMDENRFKIRKLSKSTVDNLV